MSLRELQTRVMTALLTGAAADAASLLDLPAALAASRLEVYANTLRSNFLEALRASFPAVWRLVGEDYFRQAAQQFQRAEPSRCGDLQHAGRCFPEYLAERHAADGFRYLGDVARLEWLIQEALLAADHGPLDLEKMAGVAPAAYDTLRFTLHPSLRLFESPFPVQRIWAANVDSDADPDVEPDMIDLGSGGDLLVVMRHRSEPQQRSQLRLHRMDRGDYGFLDALRRGAPFAAAVEAGDGAATGGTGFDAATSLRRWVALHAIVDFQ